MKQEIIDNSLLMKLFDKPGAFNFFQAIRLIELYHFNQVRNENGKDFLLGKYLRFTSEIGLEFKATDIEKILAQKSDKDQILSFELSVNFMSFLGSQGVLPIPFTEMSLQKIRQKDRGFVDFLNIFINRTLLLFYQAWKKQHAFLGYERDFLSGRINIQQQLFENLMGCTSSLQSTTDIYPALLFNTAHFAKRSRNSITLQQILSAYFQVPSKVLTFQGEWLNLPEEDCSRLSASSNFNRLGIETHLGKRIYFCQHRIRIQLGPLTYLQWQRFLPKHANTLKKIFRLIQSYIELHLTFDVQLILKKEDIPCFQLGNNNFHLGWNSWLYTNKFTQDSFDVILGNEIG